MAQDDTLQEMSIKLVSSTLVTSSKREDGLILQVMNSGAASGKTANGTIRFKGLEEPKVFVVLKDDGRVGINLEGRSYITPDDFNGKRFLDWVAQVSELSETDESYVDPEAVFRRCN